MYDGSRAVLRGVRPVDWVLAGAVTVLGVLLMIENVQQGDDEVTRAITDGSMVHTMSTHSWAMIPVFALATVPVLWWRRNVIAVTAVSLAAMVGHDLVFGWVTRCGAGLPLAFLLAYLGAVASGRRQAWAALGLSTALTVAVLVVDATTGFSALGLALPVLLVVFGLARAVRHRTAMSRELRARTAELHSLRDERAALEVGRRPGPAVPAARRTAAGTARPAHDGRGVGCEPRPGCRAIPVRVHRARQQDHAGGHA